jgi:hypothetical protein
VMRVIEVGFLPMALPKNEPLARSLGRGQNLRYPAWLAGVCCEVAAGWAVIHSRHVRGKIGASYRALLLEQLDIFESAYSLLISPKDAECHVMAIRDLSLDDGKLTPYGPISAL